MESKILSTKCEDRMKQSLVYDTAVSRQYFTKMLLRFFSIFGFELFSTDVTQTYL